MRVFVRFLFLILVFLLILLIIDLRTNHDEYVFRMLHSHFAKAIQFFEKIYEYLLLTLGYIAYYFIIFISIFLVTFVLYLRYTYSITIATKVEHLSAAAWELIRLMETLSPSWRTRLELARETTEQFAVDGAERLGASQHSFINNIDSSHVSTLKQVSDDIVDRWWKDAAKFRAKRGSIRNGVSVFLLLMDGHIGGAHAGMIEHMHGQVSGKNPHNFDSLKKVLYITREFPTDDSIKYYRDAGLTFLQFYFISKSLEKRHKILSKLTYHPNTPPGKDPIVIRGENILVAMRTFLRTNDTYDERLS